MDFKFAIIVLEGELSNTKHSLNYNKPHKNSNQYKAYKWRIDELEETIEYLRAQARQQQQSPANCAIFDVVQQSEQFKAVLFKMANNLAVNQKGDQAVLMHQIHNSL